MAHGTDIEVEIYPPWPENEVVVYTVKGNLALRIYKLATEKTDELLNPDQRNFENLH